MLMLDVITVLCYVNNNNDICTWTFIANFSNRDIWVDGERGMTKKMYDSILSVEKRSNYLIVVENV